jgi:hypothetical protein
MEVIERANDLMREAMAEMAKAQQEESKKETQATPA